MSNVIFISSGGTGGHIMPARCLAKLLSQNNFKVFFLADKKVTNFIKKEDSFQSFIISASQLKKSAPFLFLASIKIFFGTLKSCYFIFRYNPKYVIAFGGYATFPVLFSAIIMRRKIILHEQNSHLGKVNRIFAKYASKIATSFPETSGICEEVKKKIITTGNPIRDEIINLYKNEYSLPKIERDYFSMDSRMGYNVLLESDFYKKSNKECFHILIIGGSGGAKIFSEIMPQAFFNLSENVKEILCITQQCRSELVKSTFEKYKSFNINIAIDYFFEDMASLISRSHLVIARSGSSSIFEFCAAKKPMILVPFAESADNHQEKNATFLEKNGAAIVIKEKEFTINNVSEVISKLINNPATLIKMSQNAGDIANLNATQKLFNLINE